MSPRAVSTTLVGAALLAGVLAQRGPAGDALLACVLAALLALAAFVRGPAPIVAMAAAALFHYAGPSFERWAVDGRVQAWNVYHYTVGARFFPELGHHDLYLATLAADRAGDDSLRHVLTVRDLHTYELEARRTLEATYVLEDHFSPARAAELRRAVDALEPRLPEQDWREVFIDRGYNATPAYVAVTSVPARALPAEDPRRLWFATSLDAILLLGGLLAVLAAWGVEPAATVLLLLALFPGTEGRWFGGFLEYDWLAALLLGAASTRAGRPIPAAFALSWAIASRLFPAALLGSALLPAAAALLRRREVSPFDRTFALATAVSAALWLAVGCATARGPAAWVEFVPRILHHAQQHVIGERRIGLQHLLTWAPGPTDEVIRAQLHDQRAVLGWALAALGLAAWAWVAARRSREEALALGWVPVFLLTVSSRYYWAGVALAALVDGQRRRWIALALAAAFAVGHVADWAGASDYTQYLALEAALAAALALALALCAAAGPAEPAGPAATSA